MNRFLLSLAVCFGFTFSTAQEKIDFQKPSEEILQLADFERAPSVFMNSKKEWMVFAYRNTYLSLSELNQEEMKLGGLRFNPVTHISSTITYTNNLKVQKLGTDKTVQVKNLPSEPQISYFSFSPDETKLAFTHTTSKDVELWYVDLKTANAQKIASGLNAVSGRPYTWLKDSKRFLAYFMPENVPAFIDKEGELPTGPTVSMGDGSVSQTRTYQDLLTDAQDEENFKNAIRASLKFVDLNGKTENYLHADLYVSESLSPNGEYFLIRKIKEPFSYLVPYSRFASETSVFDLNGKQIKLIDDTPLDEIRPKGFSSTKTGKRSISWRNDKAAELYFVEALDEGDASKEVDFRDQIYVWSAPFNSSPKPLLKTKLRYGGIEWGNSDIAFVYDSWYDTRMLRTTNRSGDQIGFRKKFSGQI